MNKEIIKKVLTDQRQELAARLKAETLVEREGVELCREYLGHPNLVLVSGLRRAGKSFFAHLTAGVSRKYAFLNFDDERLLEFNTNDLNTVLECFGELEETPAMFVLDEIQNVRGWELFVNRLRNTHKIMVTGSNAHLLSREMATHLTGRFIEWTVFPMSFPEFCAFRGETFREKDVYSTSARSRIGVLFFDYLQGGGIFDHYKFGPEFLRTLWRSVIDRDIVIRYRVKYPAVLEQLASALIQSFTSKVSVANWTRHFRLKSAHTVHDYIRYLENVFLLFSVHKFSYKVKEQHATLKKMYVIDNGFIRALGFSFSEDRGKLLENLIAVELKRRSLREGLQLFYWDDYYHECDFMVKKGPKIQALYQVCAELNVTNKEREVKGLIAAAKAFGLKKGSILTLSQEETFHEGGCAIEVRSAWRWLLESSFQ